VGDGAQKRVGVSARPGGKGVRIEVEDNGPGLPDALGREVFQPYVRGPNTSKPGIGLGLATVKKITEAHGGRVEVHTAPGQGCRFTVELPAAEPSSTPGPTRTPTPSRRARGAEAGRETQSGADPPTNAP